MKPVFDYMNTSKDSKRMFAKYTKDLDLFTQMVHKEEGVDLILTTKLNEAGEFIGQPLIDALR